MVAILFGAAVLVVGIAALVVGLGVARDAREARAALGDAGAALGRADAEAARAAFERARSASASALTRVRSLPASPLRIAPVVRTQTRVVEAIARAGGLAAQAGHESAGALDAAPPGGWALQQGRVDLVAAQRAGGIMRNAAGFGDHALRELEDAPRGWLVGPVWSALEDAQDRLGGAVRGLRASRDAFESLPSLLAQGGTKRYLVAFANLAELRGSGGFLGYFTMIEVSDGRLRLLPQAGRPTEEFPPLAGTGVLFPRSYRIAYGRYGLNEWQQVNLPLDFPTVGRFIAEGVSGTVGPVDGVLQIDPIAIAGLLRLAGPVEVPSWPEPITAGNVSSVTQHDVYVRHEGDGEARSTFFAELIDAVFTKVLSSNISMTPSSATELGVAVEGGHLLVYSRHRDDQRALERLAIAGALGRANGAADVLSLVTENAAGNKADWFLRREVGYEVELDPIGGTAHGHLTASLSNIVPTSGETSETAGSAGNFLPVGTNRHIVLIARPGSDQLEGLESGGEPTSAVLASERALRVYHTSATIPARERVQMGAEFVVPDALEGTGDELTYRLHVMRQPVAHADFYEVGVVVPKGWTAEGDTRFIGDLRSDLVMDVTLRKTTRAKLLDTLALEPWRAVRNFFGRIF